MWFSIAFRSGLLTSRSSLQPSFRCLQALSTIPISSLPNGGFHSKPTFTILVPSNAQFVLRFMHFVQQQICFQESSLEEQQAQYTVPAQRAQRTFLTTHSLLRNHRTIVLTDLLRNCIWFGTQWFWLIKVISLNGSCSLDFQKLECMLINWFYTDLYWNLWYITVWR